MINLLIAKLEKFYNLKIMSPIKSTSSENTNINKYIHGFTETEQNRLIRQSQFLESYLHRQIDFSKSNNILEVGCGVGTQMRLLLNRYPNLKISGIDISEIQINRARELLKLHSDINRVSLCVNEGNKVPFADNTFDGAVIFFVLEHTEDPVSILKEVKRMMQLGSPFYCTEVFNHSLYIHPFCPSLETYWRIYNNYQRKLKGDPDIGIKLCNLALQVGFSQVKMEYIPIYLDQRNTDAVKRKNFIDYWSELFLSAAPSLLSENQITNQLLDEVKQELKTLKNNQNLIFSYTAMQLKAIK